MEDVLKRLMKRIKKKCPVAMHCMGATRYDEGDYDGALEYYIKTAELGYANAHYNLSIMYQKGGVDKDKKKQVYHWEEAAIGGHPAARHKLGIYEGNNGRFERAKEHFIIAANLGYHDSLKAIKALYTDGNASKEDYAGALRAYQAVLGAAKSADREKAERAIENGTFTAC
jgi:TPR repeat protein